MNNATQKGLLISATVSFFLYSVLNTLKDGTFYGSSLTAFITIHIVVAYIKKYVHPNMKRSYKLVGVIFSAGGLVALVLFTNFIGFFVPALKNMVMMWSTFKNPLIILFAISIFMVFNSKTFYNKAVNYISSLSLLIYMFHTNYIVMRYVRTLFFERIYNTFSYKYELLWYLLFGVVLAIYGVIMSVIYKSTLTKPIISLSNRIVIMIDKITTKIIKQ